MLEFAVNFIPAFQRNKPNGTGCLCRAGRDAGKILRNRCFSQANKRMDGQRTRMGAFSFPAGFPQHLAGVFGRMRLKRPGGVCAKLRRNSQANSRVSAIPHCE